MSLPVKTIAKRPENDESEIVMHFAKAHEYATANHMGKPYGAVCEGLNILFFGAAEATFYPGVSAARDSAVDRDGIRKFDLTAHKEIAKQTILAENNIKTLNSWMVK